MNIVHLTAGAGGMYCGTCLQSNTLAAALRAAGQAILLVPLYTPLRTDEPGESVERVAFGGIRAYLQQHLPFIRRLPRFVHRLLDRPALLRIAGRWSQSVAPQRLGPMTVSVLRGQQGRQAAQLDELAEWLRAEVRPQIVHLSTTLLAGMARQIRQHTRAAVVASLGGEDAFVDGLPEPYRAEAIALMGQACRELDGLVAPSHYCRRRMAEYLGLPNERIDVIRPGLHPQGHAEQPHPAWQRAPGRDPVLGYLARICPAKGLHLLAEAFVLLSKRPELRGMRLRAAGYAGPQDHAYLDQVRRRLTEAGLAGRFEFLPEPDRTGKLRFLQSLDVLCVPAVQPQSKALYAIEALMNGVPLVLPDLGAFSELVAESQGGLLYSPGDSEELAATLARLLTDPIWAEQCAQRGHTFARRMCTSSRMADETLTVYDRVLRQWHT